MVWAPKGIDPGVFLSLRLPSTLDVSRKLEPLHLPLRMLFRYYFENRDDPQHPLPVEATLLFVDSGQYIHTIQEHVLFPDRFNGKTFAQLSGSSMHILPAEHNGFLTWLFQDPVTFQFRPLKEARARGFQNPRIVPFYQLSDTVSEKQLKTPANKNQVIQFPWLQKRKATKKQTKTQTLTKNGGPNGIRTLFEILQTHDMGLPMLQPPLFSKFIPSLLLPSTQWESELFPFVRVEYPGRAIRLLSFEVLGDSRLGFHDSSIFDSKVKDMASEAHPLDRLPSGP
jgi:hypothetical protein